MHAHQVGSGYCCAIEGELEIALKFDPNGVKMKLDFTNKKITKQGVLTS